MTDPIADLLTRIRNGYLASSLEVKVPYSKLKESILKVLEEFEYIDSFDTAGEKTKRILIIVLAYDENGKPKLQKIRRISKPSLRKYIKANEIGYIRGGFGITIVSTSKGVMAEQAARKQKLGGEIIAEVW